jgi:hypothetical protein
MGDFDRAYDRALDAGLCSDAAGDYAYDVWAGRAPDPDPRPIVEYDDWGEPHVVGRRPGVSDDYLEAEYGWRCRRR